MRTLLPRIRMTAVAVVAFLSSSSFADLRLPPVFTDHAVLQRDAPVPVWGRASASAKIEVRLGERKASTVADANGAWTVRLEPMAASSNPADLVITAGDDRVTLHDVLVGDVWLCGGQSNMEWPMAASDGFDALRSEAASGKRVTIRALKMPHTLAESELGSNDARWRVTDGESIGSITAVGYHFAIEIADALQVPVGILDDNWGGTRIEPWLRNGQMHRGMIAPLGDSAIRGALWYQGESNAEEANKYADLLAQLVAGWREEFRRPNLPVGIVQLASFKDVSDDPVEGGWSELRAAQARVAHDVPNCGLAVTLDVGNAKDIHPRDKTTVGKRLAAWALKTEYGKDVKAWTSPTVAAVEPGELTDGTKLIRIRFDGGEGLSGRDGAKVGGFAIAGADGKFVWAETKIDSDSGDLRDHASILVWSKDVKAPVEVAYAWQNNPVRANLVNGAGWPAGPFRVRVGASK